MELGNPIVVLNLKQLFAAPWNYKKPGDDEFKARLKQSILKDNSAGVPAVRTLPKKDTFEVIDGNHRLEVLQELKVKKVVCENFGDIPEADAILIARRRNHQWFEDDVFKYAELFRDIVLPKYTLDDLQLFMPETRPELDNIATMLDFDWTAPSPIQKEKAAAVGTEIRFHVSTETLRVWTEWTKTAGKRLKVKDPAELFRLAIDKALSLETVET